MPLLESEFPVEIAELIASELDTIQDVLSFSLVCRHFHSAVNCDQSVYRSLFLRLYERPRKPEGYDYKTAFQHRHSKRFDEDVLRDIILDARPSRTQDASQPSRASSRNLDYLGEIFANRSPPPALRGLLYPLQFLSPTSHLFPQLDPTSPNWYKSILKTYHSETDKIADSFAQFLHPSNRSNSVFREGLALLQPSEFPSFWEGDLISQDTMIPLHWFGAFLYLPFDYNHRAGPSNLAMTDITLNFSTSTSFSCSGYDIASYTIQEGRIQGEGEKRLVSWIKDYGTYRWRYQGVLEDGGQRMVGVWGEERINGLLNPRRVHGLFMFWAVPEDSVSLDTRR